MYNGPERPLLALTISFVFPQCFYAVFSETLRQFSEDSNISQKFQTILESARHFSQVSESSQNFQTWNNSQKSQTIPRTLRKFSEVSNTSRKSQTVLGSFKQYFLNRTQFLELNTWKTVLRSVKYFLEVSNNPQLQIIETKRDEGIWRLFSVKNGNLFSLIMGIASAKSRIARGVSQQPSFMGSCLTISHTCLPSHVFASFVFLMFSVF